MSLWSGDLLLRARTFQNAEGTYPPVWYGMHHTPCLSINTEPNREQYADAVRSLKPMTHYHMGSNFLPRETMIGCVAGSKGAGEANSVVYSILEIPSHFRNREIP